MPRAVHDAATVEAEVIRIAMMRKTELRQLWRTFMKSDPPPAFGPDLLRRSLAFKIQEDAFGGHSAAIRRELALLIKRVSKNPTGRIELPRRIGVGAVLIREWKGKMHHVIVVKDGFLHDGQTYASLTEVANLITGAKWNGPRFFGLRKSAPQGDQAGTQTPGSVRSKSQPRVSKAEAAP
jgi:hypothetical protein